MATPPADRELSVFVSAPFAPEYEPVYSDGIVPLQYRLPGWHVHVCRADTVDPKSPLLWVHVNSVISEADLVIADITGNNPNVLLELGWALGLQRSTVIITRDKEVPANLAGHLRIPYRMESLNRLTDEIVRYLRAEIYNIVQRRESLVDVGPGRSLWRDKGAPQTRRAVPPEAQKYFDLGLVASDRQDRDAAIENWRAAVAAFENYWEAKYQLAIELSLTKREADAEALAIEVAKEAKAAGDYVHVWKAHNLVSGIHKRRGDNVRGLQEIRLAYDYSHDPRALDGEPPHIVPLKNRVVLEFLTGHDAEYRGCYAELARHPMFAAIKAELDRETGGQLPIPR